LANPELGAKQICPSCQAKFYDLNRRPATCPKCGTAFDPEEAVRTRRVRARTAAPDYETEDEPKPRTDEEVEGFEDEADDTPEIDEAAEAEPVESDEGDDDGVAPDTAEPDLGVDFEEDAPLEEEGDDVPFLEEEDEDFPEDELDVLPDDDQEDR
jgi:uncharacterized protein (TIGR02300 family)